jgi:hypothetical protein
MRTQAAQDLAASVARQQPGLRFIGASYGRGDRPELEAFSGSSGSVPIGGSTPIEYLQQLQRMNTPGIVTAEPLAGPTGIRGAQLGEDRYACGLIHVSVDRFASHDGVVCVWTLGVHRLGELFWFPSQPAGDALVSAALDAAAVVANATA